MLVLWNAILAGVIVSFISFSGVLVLIVTQKEIQQELLLLLVSFSAGALMGGAFFHLIPEALEELDSLTMSKLIVLGFSLFYLLERGMRWHHCHKKDCNTHKVLGYQNLIGDGLHNFIDGLAIIAAFSNNVALGWIVLVSIASHEIPQEIGDFGVLLYSGFSKAKALLFNFLSALTSLAGIFIGYFLISKISSLVSFLLPLAAGGFIYIAASDLIPELHREKSLRKSVLAFGMFIAAIGMMLIIKR
jgi:zinc and cadmium transporter